MRILDLGAHDGFISAYVADHYPGDGKPHIDGVELNKHAVEVFNRRLGDRGLAGVCVIGKAEDAPRLLPAGSYDAVVAYELIEHVPNVDGFLASCEAMCAPGGRIYLSTPNGTFGEGQNPHHLRVYRAVDLAELLRRRGDVQSIGVGPDGLALASYTPWHACVPELAHGRGEIALYCGPGWMTWGPPMIELPGGLGGSETAAVRLADELTALGFTVTVYGEVEPGCYGQVVYRHHSTFDPMTERAAVILSRTPWMADQQINADRVLLWMHDTDYGPNFTPAMAERIDAIMVLSHWHSRFVKGVYPFLKDAGDPRRTKVHVTSNGINPDYFVPAELPARDPYRVMYTSSPDRGLDLLLEWWPEIVKREPRATLCFCYADVYKAVAGQRPEVAAHQAKVARLADQPNVHNLGALSQPDLASAMLQSGVWVAPSWNTPSGTRFHETFCIGAVEAAAAGLHRVMSRWGALAERTENLAAWPQDDGDGPVKERWVQAILLAMDEAAIDGPLDPDEALQVTWGRVAEDFVAQMLDPVPA